jgi:hypothetical protein
MPITCTLSTTLNITTLFPICVCCVLCSTVIATAGENASNPLAAVNNTDLRYKYIGTGSNDLQDAYVEGGYMVRPELKLKYELHYNSTNSTGSRETGFEKASLKVLYFPTQTNLSETWGVKPAVGLEWIVDLGDTAKGIGSGSDQLAPFAGLAFANSKSGLSLIPLIQHYESYSGEDFSQTALRLIAIQPFANNYWAKLDLKVPYDWEQEVWPASAELQLGYNIQPGLAVYADLLVGLGSDRPYDQGVGLGLRFNY